MNNSESRTHAYTQTLPYLVLAIVVLVTYAPALRLNFFGDDYSFVERAGRLPLGEYLSFYFDPARQDGWYRPMQGMLFGIEWLLFSANPLGYHIVNVLTHLANCFLLFAIIARVTRHSRAALVAALIYCGLPLYAVAVFWPGDADFLLTFFYLLSIYSWIAYLQTRHLHTYILTYLFFLLALTTKEFGVTLPIVLFLIDRFVLQPPPASWREIFRPFASFRALLSRYLAFLLVFVFYLPMEYAIQSRSVLTNLYGYGARDQALSNFFGYLAALAFPWGLPEPFSWIWLGAMLVLLAWLIVSRKCLSALVLILAGILAFMPVVLFPWFLTRYLYMAIMAFAILFAFGLERALSRFRVLSRAFALVVPLALALIVLGNAVGTADAAADFAEIGRQSRVPFRDISQRYPTFPDNTYLYFIDPRAPTSELSGMFFVRYGTRVAVASNRTTSRRADLRAHANAYVIWFDEQQRTREIAVEREIGVTSEPRAPVDFAAPLRLEGFELATSRVKRGEALALILYWRVNGKLEREYDVSTTLKDTQARTIASSRQSLGANAVEAGEMVVNANVVIVPAEAAPGNQFQVEIELVDRGSGVSVSLRANAPANNGKIVILPFEVRDAE